MGSNLIPEHGGYRHLKSFQVACALLDRQLATLAEAFEKEGGFTERLYRPRVTRRSAP